MTDKGIITSGQIFILLFISRIITAVFCTPIISGIDSLWDFLLPVIISMVLSLIMLIPVLCMYKQNRLMSISEYSYRYFGKAGKIFTLLYALYFLVNCIYSLVNYYFFLEFIAPEGIQIWLIIISLIIACVYAAFKGIEAIVRLSGIVFVSVIIAFIIFISFLSPQLSADNYIPIVYSNMNTTIDGVIFILSGMNGIPILTMLYPITKGNVPRGAVIWNISVFLIFILSILLLTGSLGDYLNGQPFPVYQSIDGAGSLQRLNPIFLAIFTTGIFCELSMLLYVISQCVKNVSNEGAGRKCTVISGIVVVIISLFITQNRNIMSILFNNYLCFSVTAVFAVLFPIIILIANKFGSNKKRGRKSRAVFKILSLISIISISSVMFSGCNTTQLNQRFIIQGIGIDKISEKYKLTLIVLDTEVEEQENAIKLVYSEGKSVEESISSLQSRSGKDILLSQCLFIMMNRNAATDSYASLEYFIKNNDILKNTNIMISEKNADETIGTAINDMNYASADINVLSDSEAANQAGLQCSLLDYVSFRNNKYSGAVIPYIIINKDVSALQCSGSVIINQNSEIDFLNQNETVGTLIINKKADNYTETIKSEEGTETTYKIKSIISSVIPKAVNNNMSFKFDIDIFLDGNYSSETLNFIYGDIYAKVQSAIEKTIKMNCCDIFSLNKYIRSEYTEYYNEPDMWKKLLKNSETEISITVHGNADKFI